MKEFTVLWQATINACSEEEAKEKATEILLSTIRNRTVDLQTVEQP